MLADEWAEDFIARTERRCRRYLAVRQLRREALDLVPPHEQKQRDYEAETERLLAEIHAGATS